MFCVVAEETSPDACTFHLQTFEHTALLLVYNSEMKHCGTDWSPWRFMTSQLGQHVRVTLVVMTTAANLDRRYSVNDDETTPTPSRLFNYMRITEPIYHQVYDVGLSWFTERFKTLYTSERSSIEVVFNVNSTQMTDSNVQFILVFTGQHKLIYRHYKTILM